MPDCPTCQRCGRVIPPPHYPSRPRKFCGNECKFAHQREHPVRPRAPRITQPCANPDCGNEVTFLPGQRGAGRRSVRIINGKSYGYSDRVYCSLTCKHIGQRAIMTGRRPNGGIYTSPATFRVIARQEFIDKCALCGWDQAPCDVCHIIARKDGGTDDIDNVVMLCPNHHRLFDRGQIDIDVIHLVRPNCLRT
jgi:hypothetical protein